jgi:hypothetical protein
MVEENFIKLERDVPKRLKFSEHAVTTRQVKDPDTGLTKNVSVLTFTVIEEDGVPVLKPFSAISQKLRMQFEPLLESKAYLGHTFTITEHGSGFTKTYEIKSI